MVLGVWPSSLRGDAFCDLGKVYQREWSRIGTERRAMDIGRQIHTVSHAPPLAAVSPEEPHWFATQTRARHEKMVVTQLEKKGVTGFLPLVTEVHQWSDRRKVIHQPLFSCYTFVHMA